MESLLDKIRIKRDNKLVNAYQSKLQPAAQKLLFYLFSYNKEELFERNENAKSGYESKGITLPVKDFLGAYPGGKDLKVVDGACSLLASSQINITKEDEKSYIPLFEHITLSKTKILFEFNSRLAEFIVTEGSNNFTSYYYKHIRKLKSGNSVRLYDILINGSRKYPNNIIQLDELKQRMGLSSTKAYQKFSLFKQKVLTPCINDINENSDLNLKMKNIKTGRAVTAVNFIFQENDQEEKVEVNKENTSQQESKNVSFKQAISFHMAVDPISNDLKVSPDPQLSAVLQDKIQRLQQRLKEIGMDMETTQLALNLYAKNPDWKIWPEVNAVKMAIKDGEKFPNKHTLKKWIMDAYDTSSRS
ncbi:replication initiation protein [Chondrinema litorale]|uniref:replication initiation protein n=1 Tax=Chondrinema litorale TaxID=2994555 RepID=UPI002542ED78|nr:replication initiation protein [Chondrinema litorale]UZS00232.1 replication initiation protein [Chondrinema litorale]